MPSFLLENLSMVTQYAPKCRGPQSFSKVSLPTILGAGTTPPSKLTPSLDCVALKNFAPLYLLYCYVLKIFFSPTDCMQPSCTTQPLSAV